MFDYIPDEIVCEIFQCIYATDYCALARVNKRFNNIITAYKSSVIFAIAKSHFPSVQMIRSKNGVYGKIIKNKDKIISFGSSENRRDDSADVWFYIRGGLGYLELDITCKKIRKSRHNSIEDILQLFTKQEST